MKKNNEEKRENIIIKTSIIGILVNNLLVIFKATVGLLSYTTHAPPHPPANA